MNMFLLCTLLFCAFASAFAYESQWHSGNFGSWADFHGKKYATAEEEAYRFTVYITTLEDIDARNAAQTDTVFAANKFSDLTPEEFSSMYLNHRRNHYEANPENVMQGLNIQRSIHFAGNDTVDWTTTGATTAPKDQEQCGSCWAFSATEEIESMWYMAGNEIPTLAPQQIVDCDTKGQDQGCNGGFTEGAYDYIIGAGGQMSESSYPYTGRDGQCKFSASDVAAQPTGYTYAVPKATVFTAASACSGGGGLEAAINIAPISVCVDASPWQSYFSGIMTQAQCSSSVLSQDHCVQLVGYSNTAGDKPYYIVRNSWGADWGSTAGDGNRGYIYLEKDDSSLNVCGVCDDATFVTV